MALGALFRRLNDWYLEVTNSPTSKAEVSKNGDVTPLLCYAITICSLTTLSLSQYSCACVCVCMCVCVYVCVCVCVAL